MSRNSLQSLPRERVLIDFFDRDLVEPGKDLIFEAAAGVGVMIQAFRSHSSVREKATSDLSNQSKKTSVQNPKTKSKITVGDTSSRPRRNS